MASESTASSDQHSYYATNPQASSGVILQQSIPRQQPDWRGSIFALARWNLRALFRNMHVHRKFVCPRPCGDRLDCIHCQCADAMRR